MLSSIRGLMDSVNQTIFTKDKEIEKMEERIIALEACNNYYLSLLKELEEKLRKNGIEPYTYEAV